MHFKCVLCCLYLASRWYKYASAGFTVFGFYLIAKHAFRYMMERRRHWELKKRYNSENSHEWLVCKLWWFAFFFFLLQSKSMVEDVMFAFYFELFHHLYLAKNVICFMHWTSFLHIRKSVSQGLIFNWNHTYACIWWALLYTIGGSLIDCPLIHGLKFENMNWLTCIWIGWVVILYNFYSDWMFIIMALV